MKKCIVLSAALVILACTVSSGAAPSSASKGKEQRNSHYVTNRKPLLATPYTALPLGTIAPEGMLLKMLQIQAEGLTGHLDEVYELVCGDNNGWLGGTGDGWERGPYWIDGLLPLAYILKDESLVAKAQKWVDWTLDNQREDGYIGPRELPEGYERILGTQQGNRGDWWPRMVMLKILRQYYGATGDERVISCLTKYFHYMLRELPACPLGKWTYWAAQRGGDNLDIVYWLYNITGDKDLLTLGELIHSQTTPWTRIFTDNTIRNLNPYPHLHCVNVAQGIKEPAIYYQQSLNPAHRNAVREGLRALRDCHGFVNGMYGGDEHLHGNNPSQGIELCSVVEMMFSFESILPVTGDMYYADYLEKLAYNCLPTQTTDDYMRKQYFQQPNQVEVSFATRNFFNDNYGRTVYGTTTGYPCCLTNMHQGWPKFIQSLWFASADNGLAALVYGPSTVTAKVGAKGSEVTIREKTDYPFRDIVRFEVGTPSPVTFPLHLRIPQWCKNPVLKVNGAEIPVTKDVTVISRTWSDGDVVELTVPMEFRYSRWYEQTAGIERGPLVYALKIGEKWTECKGSNADDTYWEVSATTPWNYGLPVKMISSKVQPEVTVSDNIADNPWNIENAPIQVKVKAKRIEGLGLEHGDMGKIYLPARNAEKAPGPLEEIVLIPYGCTTLRVCEFPVIGK